MKMKVKKWTSSTETIFVSLGALRPSRNKNLSCWDAFLSSWVESVLNSRLSVMLKGTTQ